MFAWKSTGLKTPRCKQSFSFMGSFTLIKLFVFLLFGIMILLILLRVLGIIRPETNELESSAVFWCGDICKGFEKKPKKPP